MVNQLVTLFLPLFSLTNGKGNVNLMKPILDQERLPTLAAILTLLVMIFADFVIPIQYDLLFGTTQSRGFLDDWNFLFTDFVLIPTLAYWFFKGPKNILLLWTHLENSRVISSPRDLVSRIKKRVSSPKFLLGGVFFYIVLILATYFSNRTLKPQPWWLANGVTTFIRLFTWGWGFFLGSVVLFRELATLFDLRKVFSLSSVRLRPYHSDGNSGFGFVVNYLLSFTFLIALFGASFAIWEFWLWKEGLLNTPHGWVVQIGLIVYIILTPVAFFTPLSAIHQVMQEAKEKILAYVAVPLHQFLDALAIADSSLIASIDSAEGYEALLKKIGYLEDIHSVIERYSSWPLNVRGITSFFALLFAGIAPLIPVVLGLLLN